MSTFFPGRCSAFSPGRSSLPMTFPWSSTRTTVGCGGGRKVLSFTMQATWLPLQAFEDPLVVDGDGPAHGVLLLELS